MSVIITVSRQLASRGSYVAAAVAKRLGLRYLDREILNRAAEKAGYPDEEMVAQLEQKEQVPGGLQRLINAVNTMPRIPTIASATLREGYAYDERLATLMVQEGLNRDEAFQWLAEHERRVEAGEAYAELVRQVILEYAQMGDVIIAGRGGQVILQEHPTALHVRIQAPEAQRVLRLTERLGLDHKAAQRQIRQSDKERARYMQHFHGVDWENPDLYHLSLNTGKIAVLLSALLICEAAQRLCQQVPI